MAQIIETQCQAMNQKILESQDYLRQAARWIKNGELCPRHANESVAINNLELTQKLGKVLPFSNFVIAGMCNTALVMPHGGFLGLRPKTINSVIPCQNIITGSENEMSLDLRIAKEYPELFETKMEEITDDHANPRLFRICDALGGYAMKPNGMQAIRQSPISAASALPFRLLDWRMEGLETPVHLTPVDKLSLQGSSLFKTSVVRKSVDRMITWQQIHHAIEVIAADQMKERGIT